MSENQKQYEEQDQENMQGGSETKSLCLKCCCDYMKGSVKAVCKMFECIAGCS